jgi:hypothetical protein
MDQLEQTKGKECETVQISSTRNLNLNGLLLNKANIYALFWMLFLGSKEGLEYCFAWTSSHGKGADSVEN